MGERAYFFSKNIGLCVKDEDYKVESQNEYCLKICGNQLGKVCHMGCMKELSRLQPSSEFKEQVQLFRDLAVASHKVDNIVYHDCNKVITLLFDAEEILNRQLNALSTYKLSAAELKIVRYFLTGMGNTEIADVLFISKSTLRTHLNNIYRKIPQELKREILNSHFRRKKQKA